MPASDDNHKKYYVLGVYIIPQGKMHFNLGKFICKEKALRFQGVNQRDINALCIHKMNELCN